MHPSYDGASLRALRQTLTIRLATVLLVITALAVTGVLTLTPRAHAATASGSTSQSASGTSSSQHMTREAQFRSRADRVLHVARNQKGDPYRYGAAGPGAFDCSGLVMYVFKHALGKSLPHNAAAQYHRSSHIHRSQLRPGDLIFVSYGGYISHVGIYAGGHYWWVAPHSGTRVHKQRIYHAHFKYGRVIHAFH